MRTDEEIMVKINKRIKATTLKLIKSKHYKKLK